MKLFYSFKVLLQFVAYFIKHSAANMLYALQRKTEIT